MTRYAGLWVLTWLLYLQQLLLQKINRTKNTTWKAEQFLMPYVQLCIYSSCRPLPVDRYKRRENYFGGVMVTIGRLALSQWMTSHVYTNGHHKQDFMSYEEKEHKVWRGYWENRRIRAEYDQYTLYPYMKFKKRLSIKDNQNPNLLICWWCYIRLGIQKVSIFLFILLSFYYGKHKKQKKI